MELRGVEPLRLPVFAHIYVELQQNRRELVTHFLLLFSLPRIPPAPFYKGADRISFCLSDSARVATYIGEKQKSLVSLWEKEASVDSLVLQSCLSRNLKERYLLGLRRFRLEGWGHPRE